MSKTRGMIAIELIIGIAASVFGIVVGYLGFHRNRDKDVKSDAANDAVVRTKLDSIGQGVDSIRVDFKVHEAHVRDLSERVKRNAGSTKQANKRIDEVGSPK